MEKYRIDAAEIAAVLGCALREDGLLFSLTGTLKLEYGNRALAGDDTFLENDTDEAQAARRAWARLIKKIYEVAPLICPKCSGPMRIISFSEEEDVIRKTVEHLKLWEESEPRPPPTVPEQVDIQYVPFFDS